MISLFLRRFLRDDGGNILMIFGLTVAFLVAVGGAGIDLGRQQLVHAKLQNASDAAATSAASIQRLSDAQRRTVATRYFELNTPDNFVGVNRPSPSVNITPIALGEKEIQVSANTPVSMKFVKTLGLSDVGGTGSGTANFTGPPEVDFVFYFEGMSPPPSRSYHASGDFFEGDQSSMDVKHLFLPLIQKLTGPGTDNRITFFSPVDGNGERGCLGLSNCNRYDVNPFQLATIQPNTHVLTEIPFSSNYSDLSYYLNYNPTHERDFEYGNTDVSRHLSGWRDKYMQKAINIVKPKFRPGALKVFVYVAAEYGQPPNYANVLGGCQAIKDENILLYVVELPRENFPWYPHTDVMKRCATASPTNDYYFSIPIDNNATGKLYLHYNANRKKNMFETITTEYNDIIPNHISTTVLNTMFDEFHGRVTKVRIVK